MRNAIVATCFVLSCLNSVALAQVDKEQQLCEQTQAYALHAKAKLEEAVRRFGARYAGLKEDRISEPVSVRNAVYIPSDALKIVKQDLEVMKLTLAQWQRSSKIESARAVRETASNLARRANRGLWNVELQRAHFELVRIGNQSEAQIKPMRVALTKRLDALMLMARKGRKAELVAAKQKAVEVKAANEKFDAIRQNAKQAMDKVLLRLANQRKVLCQQAWGMSKLYVPLDRRDEEELWNKEIFGNYGVGLPKRIPEMAKLVGGRTLLEDWRRDGKRAIQLIDAQRDSVMLKIGSAAAKPTVESLRGGAQPFKPVWFTIGKLNVNHDVSGLNPNEFANQRIDIQRSIALLKTDVTQHDQASKAKTKALQETETKLATLQTQVRDIAKAKRTAEKNWPLAYRSVKERIAKKLARIGKLEVEQSKVNLKVTPEIYINLQNVIDAETTVIDKLRNEEANLRRINPQIAAKEAELAGSLKENNDKAFELLKQRATLLALAQDEQELLAEDQLLLSRLQQQLRVLDEQIAVHKKRIAGLLASKVLATRVEIFAEGKPVYVASLWSPDETRARIQKLRTTAKAEMAKAKVEMDTIAARFRSAHEAAKQELAKSAQLQMTVAYWNAAVESGVYLFEVGKAWAQGGPAGAAAELMYKAGAKWVDKTVIDPVFAAIEKDLAGSPEIKEAKKLLSDYETELGQTFTAKNVSKTLFWRGVSVTVKPELKAPLGRVFNDTLNKWLLDSVKNRKNLPLPGGLTIPRPSGTLSRLKNQIRKMEQGTNLSNLNRSTKLGKTGKSLKEGLLKDLVKSGAKWYGDNRLHEQWLRFVVLDQQARVHSALLTIARTEYFRLKDVCDGIDQGERMLLSRYRPELSMLVRQNDRFERMQDLRIVVTYNRSFKGDQPHVRLGDVSAFAQPMSEGSYTVPARSLEKLAAQLPLTIAQKAE